MKKRNKVFKRFSDISNGKNQDSSNEYYTLYYAFAELLLEVLCRYQRGTKYKVIICPCDSETSVFRELPKYAEWLGNPKIIFSHYPDKSWEDYFDMDYQKEYGCKASEVLIFTNPPFKGLGKALTQIRCDYLLFGSNAVSIRTGTYAKEGRGFVYIKNNEDFSGNADQFEQKYGSVKTFFYSNRQFVSKGKQYTNETKHPHSVLFGRRELKLLEDTNK
jgi:hypothetical protein